MCERNGAISEDDHSNEIEVYAILIWSRETKLNTYSDNLTSSKQTAVHEESSCISHPFDRRPLLVFVRCYVQPFPALPLFVNECSVRLSHVLSQI